MTLKNVIKTWHLYYSKSANKINIDKCKIRIYPVGIYLLKFSNENPRTWCVICSELTKKKNTPEEPHWHEDIKKHWHCSGISVVNFEKIPYIFLIFHSWILEVLPLGFTSKDRCKLYHINQKGQLQHEKKCVFNLKSMQSVGFEQTFTKFIDIFIPQEQFLDRKKCSGNCLSGHHW